jgi:phage tail-like protein
MATTAERSDPVRNFKFNVQAVGETGLVFGTMGFMSIEGISMDTDMLPYREGGFNTTPHKLPGQTNFQPLTMNSGVFYDKPNMWNLAKQMFSVQHGAGTLGMSSSGEISKYRYSLVVRVMGHPVTKGPESMSPGSAYEGALLAFEFINCWTASVGFGGLDAQNNGILVHQMTVHHEGFEVYFGHDNAVNLRDATNAAGTSVLPSVL